MTRHLPSHPCLGTPNGGWWLLLAAALLAVFGCSQPHEAHLVIDLEIVNLPAGMTVTSLPVQGIEVSLSGDRDVVHSLTQRQLKYPLDLTAAAAGILRYTVDPARIDLPKGVTVTGVSPQALSLKIEPEMRKRVPIELVLIGSPASGYETVGSRVDPEAVVLTGPRRLLAGMRFVATKPIDVTGMTETVRRSAALELDRLMTLADPDSGLTAEIEIRPLIIQKTLSGVAVSGRGSPFAIEITPDTVMLVVKGPATAVDQMPQDGQTAIYLDLEGLKPGVYVRRAVISLPADTNLVSAAPELFTVKIHDRPAPAQPQ
jgi:YbbR domain-containing protein